MQKDFLDITHRILVLIRSDIENESNVEMLKIFIDSMLKKNTTDELVFRISQISPSYSDMLGLSSSGKENRALTLKEEDVFSAVMKYAMNLIKDSIAENQYECAYDIADCIHAFPTVLLEADIHTLKEYWKIYIKPVRKKWERHLFDEVRRYFGQR